ncbi:MAG: hypothetical protein JXA54_14435 [Candidatus Heimdallarchaeota archaeon]|nr:hypothetical protein [Candidatus Heimdallarchaeota archaeon]
MSSSFFYSINAEINVNNSFIYKITSAGHYFNIGDFLTTKEGFGLKNYTVGTKVNAIVDYIVSNGVGYKFWVDDEYWIGFVSFNKLNSWGVDFSYMTLYLVYQTIANKEFTYLIDLAIYHIYPYFDPMSNSYITEPNQLAIDISNIFKNYPNIECLNHTNVIDNVVYFESWVGGEINLNFGYAINDKENYPSDISFGNNFHFAINQLSGIVYGFGTRGWVEGVINGTNVKVSMSCEYVLEGYDLPDYSFGSFHNFLRNNKLIISLSTVLPGSVILIVGTIILVTFKRKKIVTGNHH